ncbi:class II aldolase/adducin family protein [Ferribacterium limneticum]|uniref:class II aldolase/adducin family protein n=1 Tax=Ferribacterium limneticum TaxID=76259 RepID=UPI001CF9DAC6|nr:class II aldolase/adducin family protein [Ferribacterium limneticum]UCV17750.1 class II aldolase/adducin family protein [Ferribacterium limneticum]
MAKVDEILVDEDEMQADIQDKSRQLRVAARALSRAGLVHAFGHCSIRIDESSFIVSPAKPLGNIRAGEAGVIVPIDGGLPEGVLGEVRLHQAIYRKREDVKAICRITPRQVELLSLIRRTPQVRNGLSVFFDPCPPFWNDPRLLREDLAAARLAEQLGSARAIVMRANGAVVVGVDLAEAVAMSWLLEEAARVELGLMQISRDGEDALLTSDEIKARLETSGHVGRRIWEFLTSSDEEAVSMR